MKQRRERSVVRDAVVRFVASSVILLVVLMAATFVLAGHIATQQALRDARTRGSAIGNLVVGPLVTAGVRAHVPGAGAELATVVRNRMSDGSVVHVKLWTSAGEVIWSDENALVGRTFQLTDDVKALFGTSNAIAALSDPSTAENEGDPTLGQLIEVYAGARAADHTPLVFETYFSSDTMHRDEQAIFRGYLPVIFAALVLFQVAVLPMALSLARRVERAQAERSTLMRHALLASDLERRRISTDLHDGVIQDLAGLSYAMPTLEAHFEDGPGEPISRDTARQTTHRIAQILMRDVAALRSLTTDIYPPDLEGPGLRAALQELARTAGERGVHVQLEMAPDLTAPLDTARLAYRVVREGLRNSVKHAQASAATVDVCQEAGLMVVRVSDNGRGVQDGQVTSGHLGLRLLEDTVKDLGGRMSLRSQPTRGAVLEVSFPVGPSRP